MRKALLHRPETAVDVFKLLPEGVYCQVINNVIYMSPAPSFEHQDVIAELLLQVRQYVNKMKLGKCVASPVDVFLDKHNAFQPDIILIAAKNSLAEVKSGKVFGAPDLVIEVLSPGNADEDRIKKKKVYEKCGVKEYFIVDPLKKEAICYYNSEKKFGKGIALKGKITSRMLKKTFKF